MSLSPEQMQDAVHRYFASWASLDPSAYAACFTEDAVVHNPYGTQPYQGTKALRTFFGEVALALQEVTIEATAVHIAGNRAAVAFQGKAIGKNGKPVHMDGIDVFEFNDAGRITTLWATGTAPSCSPSFGSDQRDRSHPIHSHPLHKYAVWRGMSTDALHTCKPSAHRWGSGDRLSLQVLQSLAPKKRLLTGLFFRVAVSSSVHRVSIANRGTTPCTTRQ